MVFVLLATLALASPLAGQTAPAASSDPRELYRIGRRELTEERPYRAVELFTAALRTNPDYLEPMAGLSEAYFALEEWDTALSFVRRARELARRRTDLMNLEGSIRIAMGDLEGAGELFHRVLSVEPNNLDARMGMAQLDVAGGKTRNASVRFLETLGIDPRNRRALLSLALLSEESGDREAADRYLDLVLRHHGENPQVHLLAGRAALRRGDALAAVEHARTARALRPAYTDARILEATALLLRHDFGAAETAARRVLSDEPDHALAWYFLAKSLQGADRIRDGIHAYSSATLYAPDDEIARLALENMLIRDLSAEDSARREFALHHFSRAEEEEDRNLFDHALASYRRGLQIDPYSRNGRLGYARLLRRTGFPAKYLAELRVLVNLGHQDREITDLIELQEGARSDSVASRWNVDQFVWPKHRYRFAVYHTEPQMVHTGAEEDIARAVRDRLNRYENITVPEEPAEAPSFAAAFSEARANGSEYFLLLRSVETEREFSVSASLYLSRTGTLLTELRSVRTGNDRVRSVLSDLAERVHALMPIRGRLIERRFDEGIIDLGSADGIEEGTRLALYREGSVRLSPERPGFVSDPADLLGELVVTRTDELISEGTVSRAGYFDRINAGDAVIELPEEPTSEPDPPGSGEGTRDLYRRLREIR